MAFLTCRVCGWTGNRGTSCPDAESCGWSTLVTDEVADVPIDVSVSDTMAEYQDTHAGAALVSVYTLAKAACDSTLPPVHEGYLLVDRASMEALRAGVVEVTVELSKEGGKPCE